MKKNNFLTAIIMIAIMCFVLSILIQNFTQDSSNEKEQSNGYFPINSESDIQTALDYFQKKATDISEVQITVTFPSDYENTEKYITLSNKLKNPDNNTDISALRTELNAYSKEYHYGIYQNNMEHLSEIDYYKINHIGYTPSAVLYIKIESLEEESLLELLHNEAIISIVIDTIPKTVDL